MGQKLWGDFVDCFWFKASQEVAVKMVAGLQLSEGLTGAGGFASGWFSHMLGKMVWLLVGGLSSLPHGPLHRTALVAL